MKRHLIIVCGIWCCYFFAALNVICAFVGYSSNMPLEGYISFLFGFGFFINEVISPKWIGGIPISDWRWLLGVLIMLASSLPPIIARKIGFRILGYVFHVCVLAVSLYGLLYDMICAVT